MEALLRSCAEVRESIKLSFGWRVGSVEEWVYQTGDHHVRHGEGAV